MDRSFKFLLCLISLSNSCLAAEWTRVTEVPAAEFLSVMVDGGALYAGGLGTIYVLDNCSAEWRALTALNNDADNVSSMIKAGSRMFAGSWGEGVFESTDGGNSWIARNGGLGAIGGTVPMDFAVRGDSLYVATDGAGVYLMDLNGEASWSPYRDGLSFGVSWNVGSIVDHNGVLIAGAGANGELSMRSRTDAAWQSHQFSQFEGQILAMQDLLSYGDTVYGAASDGLYASGDSGKTWEQYLPSIGLLSSQSVAAADGRVFAMICKPGLFTRIYQRSAGGWTQVDEIGFAIAYDIAIHCNRLYMAQSNGLWYKELDPTDVPDDGPVLPRHIQVSQNYPNPFNPSTTIAFEIRRENNVKLTIFNLLGQEVRVLVDGIRPAGKHELEWDGRDRFGNPAPTGVYFYRLEASSFSETRKMALVK